MLTYEAALKRILAQTPSPSSADVPLEAALGLVLVEPVVSPLDLPGFDNSAVDGYAVRTQDFSARSETDLAPWMLRVVGHARAGAPFARRLRTGEAVRILTGAQIPQGASAVIMQEHAVRKNDWLFIEHLPQLGQHIRRQGEDLRRGTRVLEPGTCLRPQELELIGERRGGLVNFVDVRKPEAAAGIGDERKFRHDLVARTQFIGARRFPLARRGGARTERAAGGCRVKAIGGIDAQAFDAQPRVHRHRAAHPGRVVHVEGCVLLRCIDGIDGLTDVGRRVGAAQPVIPAVPVEPRDKRALAAQRAVRNADARRQRPHLEIHLAVVGKTAEVEV